MKRSDVAIRPAVAEDAATIAAIVRLAYQIYIPRLGRAPAAMRVDHARAVAAGGVHIAIHRGAVVGVVTLTDTDAGCLLNNLAVAPDAQRRGIGRALIDFAENQARTREHDHITLYTNEQMSENIALYRRLGYVEVARRREAGYRRIYIWQSRSVRKPARC